jgi:glucuronosyltransferase
MHVQVTQWLPQNDLLSHPQTRAFLSHVGINSMYEARSSFPSRHLPACPSCGILKSDACAQALYHAKPIIALPCFGDQFTNADKVVAKVRFTLSNSQPQPGHALAPLAAYAWRPAQGFGVTVDPSQIGTRAFEAAILEVLLEPKYAHRANAVSRQLRARKRSPVQEAAGACSWHLSWQLLHAFPVRTYIRS